MMRRLNQFQVSELFPLLNFPRHTVEEVQKRGQGENKPAVNTFETSRLKYIKLIMLNDCL